MTDRTYKLNGLDTNEEVAMGARDIYDEGEEPIHAVSVINEFVPSDWVETSQITETSMDDLVTSINSYLSASSGRLMDIKLISSGSDYTALIIESDSAPI